MTELWHELFSARDATTFARGYWTDIDECPAVKCLECGGVAQSWKPLPIHLAVQEFDVQASVVAVSGTPAYVIKRKLADALADRLTPHVIGEVWVGEPAHNLLEDHISIYAIEEFAVEGSPCDEQCSLCGRFVPGPAQNPFVRRGNLPSDKYQAFMTLRQHIVISESLKQCIDWQAEFPDVIFEEVVVRD